MKRITVTELDHIVLNVRDIDHSLVFYINVLGLTPERLDEFRAGKVSFPSVRINQETIIDLFPIPEGKSLQKNDGKREANLNHFCMVIGREDFAGILCPRFEKMTFSSKLSERAAEIAEKKYGTNEWLTRW